MKAIKKSDIRQMLTNSNDGKLSITKLAGAVIILVGTFGFIYGIVDKTALSNTANILDESVLFTSLGAALLGVKNIWSGTKNKSDAVPNN